MKSNKKDYELLKNTRKYNCGAISLYNYLVLNNTPLPFKTIEKLLVNGRKGVDIFDLSKALNKL